MDASPIQPEVEARTIFPPPPNVHWGVLLAAQIAIAMLARFLAPREYWTLILDLSFDVWAIYFCLWIRRIEPAAMSLFWCVAYIALQIAFSVPGTPVQAIHGFTYFAATLALLCVAIWFITVYVIRAELHFHYNLREPVGLYLNGIMTFFFSFLYFQYHLYKIAQLRQRNGDRPFYYQAGPTSLPDE